MNNLPPHYDDGFPAAKSGSASHAREASQTFDEGKLVIAIDFGTTFSGVAYASSRIASGKIQQIINWPESRDTHLRKIPTCLLYDEQGRVLAWGLEAKYARNMSGTSHYEWFKLFLDPRALQAPDPRLPSLPPGKTPTDLITDFLSCLWEYARDQIARDVGASVHIDTADVWVTVPATWDPRGCALMRDAAIAAGVVQSAHPGDVAWRDRLKIITEPEAAAVHCAHLTDLYRLRPSQNFMICDAGGGTVDLATYKIIGELAHLEMTQVSACSGANCGSLFLDLRFRALIETLLTDHPAHLDMASLAHFMHSFSEADKMNYTGRSDDETMFYFGCFNVMDPDDPSVGLINGQLEIPGRRLREAVFDPVVNDVLDLISRQLEISPNIDALLLVGGFSGSTYLKTRVEEQFNSRIHMLARPPDSDAATLRGAVRYGLARRRPISQFAMPRSYIMQVQLPAKPEDRVRSQAHVNGVQQPSTGSLRDKTRATLQRIINLPKKKNKEKKTQVVVDSDNSVPLPPTSSHSGAFSNVLLGRVVRSAPDVTMESTFMDSESLLYQNTVANGAALVDAFLQSQEKRTALLVQCWSDARKLALRRSEEHISTSLLAILGSRDAKRATMLLEGFRARAFLDAALGVLERGTLPSADDTSRARKLMIRLSEARDQLPSALFITGITNHDEHPTFSGGFADIYRASLNGSMVALKRIRKFQAGAELPRSRLEFCREVLTWQTLRHPYVLPLFGIDRETFPTSLCMVSPWMQHGTIMKYLKDYGRADVYKMLFQIAQGLAYLHSMKIVHGDLRGTNILVSDDWNVCLADFGLTGVIEDTSTTGAATSTTNRAGSSRWFAPELIVPTAFGCGHFLRTPATDVYAFACVCIELHTGNPPLFDITPDMAAMLKVVEGVRPPRPAFMLDHLWDLITTAWAQNRLERPSMATIVEMMDHWAS